MNIKGNYKHAEEKDETRPPAYEVTEGSWAKAHRKGEKHPLLALWSIVWLGFRCSEKGLGGSASYQVTFPTKEATLEGEPNLRSQLRVLLPGTSPPADLLWDLGECSSPFTSSE